MKAGNLDRRWKLEEKTVTQTDSGFEEITWVEKDTVWGSFEPLRGQERWAAKQFVPTEPVRVRIRHYPGLSPLDAVTLVETGERYDVHSIEDYRRNGEMVLTVSRQVEE